MRWPCCLTLWITLFFAAHGLSTSATAGTSSSGPVAVAVPQSVLDSEETPEEPLILATRREGE